ncbi:hypothetical protein FRX31_018697 [Thalictrum thalictroides]|uniref:Reverse transcriptase zinc-binding domain-containing protein n=1 Tax=Thalictrum thalictroides TaxID=46969 RepID=A0A7J6W431_THATH|nr:hypothetical protein FRX31_018697 [Thalictrum thalictroides]
MEENDTNIWTPSSLGSYSIKTSYAAFRRRKNKQAWTKLLWHKKMVPRQSFTTWLAVRGKLNTQDWLMQ